MPDARLTPEQLARFRADYHQCRTTIVPLLDEIEAAWADVARLQRQVEGHCERIVKQSELLSRRAEKGSEALTAERDRLRAACRDALARLSAASELVVGLDGQTLDVGMVRGILRHALDVTEEGKGDAQ